MPVVELLAGLTLVAVELLRSVPAWQRLRRTGRVDGVSVISMGVLAGSSVGWIAVAVLAQSISAAVATVLWLVFHLLECREILRIQPQSSKQLKNAAGVSFIAMIAASLVGATLGSVANGLGVAVALAAAAYALPALVSGMTSHSTAGLSVVSLVVNSVEGALYLSAGLGMGGISPGGSTVLGYVAFGAIAIVSNVPRLMRTSLRRMQGSDPVPLT